MKTINLLTKPYGIPLTVRMIEHGERYGRGNCLEHELNEPLIEFNIENGLEVVRYCISTVQELRSGLVIDSSQPELDIDSESIEEIQKWLDSQSSVGLCR